ARLRQRLQQHAFWLREALTQAGFTLKPGQHPILPVMIGDAALSVRMADELLQEGIYVIGFSYPVVPQGQARIRIQVSALHEPEHLERAAAAFRTVGRRLGVIS
ncbi:MAG: aminotransferase class I/II-fold pyridoxal phosphate-dependent enzyme, partial [Gemmatales bacterium]|nr:aminotransferase class I/II-fold pyridoxal phosphate-dependent enzyme [Gemmatales bacterium]MDW8176784.1 aminotransferase class I/II-fold pyridoxal phosphate-dependent enzyme [Gemmatales bacterium]